MHGGCVPRKKLQGSHSATEDAVEHNSGVRAQSKSKKCLRGGSGVKS
jgi:hypothetical protein